MLSFLINIGMKTTLLEWYDKSLTEANLGMNSKIKKRHQEASVEDEVERVGSAYIDFSGKNQEEILASLIEQAKRIYHKESNIKLAKSWNQIHTKVCLSVSFKQYVDQMNISFSPRLYIAIDEDRHVDISLDFRIDTSGSGNFNSRYIPLASGQIEETNEEIYNAMLNVRKLNKLEGSQYPSEWSKREYTKFVSGFTTSSWVPPIVASSDFNSKTIDEWMMLPAYCDGKFFNYDKALEDMLGQDIEYEVYKYKELTPALEPYVKYKRRYRQELEGNIFRALVIVQGKWTKEQIYDLGLRLYVYFDSSYKGFFTDVNSYYRLEDNGNIIYPEQDPKLMELVTKVDVESELFKIVKHNISHYITSNKNSTIVKNAKKRILDILSNENKVNESNLGLNNKVKKKYGVETLEKTAEDIAHDFSSGKSTLATIVTEAIYRSLDGWYVWFGQNIKLIQIITPLFSGTPSLTASGVMEIFIHDTVPSVELKIGDEHVAYDLSDKDEGKNKIAFDNCMQILFNFTEYVMSEEYDDEDVDGFDNFIAMHGDQISQLSSINKRDTIINILKGFGLLD